MHSLWWFNHVFRGSEGPKIHRNPPKTSKMASEQRSKKTTDFLVSFLLILGPKWKKNLKLFGPQKRYFFHFFLLKQKTPEKHQKDTKIPPKTPKIHQKDTKIPPKTPKIHQKYICLPKFAKNVAIFALLYCASSASPANLPFIVPT